MAKAFRKAHVGREPIVTIKDFPNDDPENGDIFWVKIKRPNGETFTRLTALQGLTKQDETGKIVLAMNPVEALVTILPESIVEWNAFDYENNVPIEVSYQNVMDLDPADFQHLLNGWSALIAAGRRIETPKVGDPKGAITQDEKKPSQDILAKESVSSSDGETPSQRLQLVLPLADG